MKRIGVVFTLALLVLAATPARADTEVFTETFKNVTETFSDVVPCVGVDATITTVENGVFHVTQLDDGTYHLTGTFTGTFTAVAENGVTYTGRFTVWFGENSNRFNFSGTFTFRIKANGSDGSSITFNAVAQFKVTPKGATPVMFEKFKC